MENRIVVLGFFDGVHLGHGTLLRRAKERSAELGCPTMAVSFDRHPYSVISGREVRMLTSLRDREYLLKQLYGMDEVEFLHFGYSLMTMPWEEFLRLILIEELHAVHVVCGWDYHFGFRGEGTAEKLRAFCEGNGIGCDVMPEYSVNGIPVHSTAIRELLSDGRLEEASVLLGHPHLLSGTVISGKHLGRTMGTPTANLSVPHGVLALPKGVYAAKAEVDGTSYCAVTNVGVCPTVSEGAPMTVESWLLDYSGDLYGRELRIFFYRMLRPEQKFESVDELKAAIYRDGETAKAYFETRLG